MTKPSATRNVEKQQFNQRASLSSELEELKKFLIKGKFEEREDYTSLVEEKGTWADYRLTCTNEESRESMIQFFSKHGIKELCSLVENSLDIIITLFEGFKTPKIGSQALTFIPVKTNFKTQKTIPMTDPKESGTEVSEIKKMLKSLGYKVTTDYYLVSKNKKDNNLSITFASRSSLDRFINDISRNNFNLSHKISERNIRKGKPSQTLILSVEPGFTNPVNTPAIGAKKTLSQPILKNELGPKLKNEKKHTSTSHVLALLDEAKNSILKMSDSLAIVGGPEKVALKLWSALGGEFTVDSIIVSLKKPHQPKMLAKEDFIELFVKTLKNE